MINSITYSLAAPADYEDVVSLLSFNGLPTKDINPVLPLFIVAKQEDKLVACIGLEKFGSEGLLRSMGTRADFQRRGIATQLFNKLIALSKTEGISTLYLLTESAETYFSNKGFTKLDREAAHESIKQSQEFRNLCPSTAVLMKKEL